VSALVAMLAVMVSLAGCGGAASDGGAGSPTLRGPVDEIGGARPAAVFYPADYAAEVSLPLVVMLHGFSATALLQDVIFGLKDRVDEGGFVLITPEGTADPEGDQFWNATHECCDFFNLEPDDVAYISGLIAEARAHFAVDPARIALVGHSNGGYMANRYACDQRHGTHQVVTRIVNLAGLSHVNAQDCGAVLPVDVLHVHGTADERVFYESNVTDPSLSNPDVVEDDPRLRAGAMELAERWAARADCAAAPDQDLGVYDLSNAVTGAETDALVWPGCTHGSSTLLRANGVGHLWLDATDELRDLVTDFAIE